MNYDFLEPHLNVAWLRPESALWDVIASQQISQYQIIAPSLDLGCGNGIFSFITAGGKFTSDYDWYRNINTSDFWDNSDVYDVCVTNELDEFIAEKPKYSFTYALDHKPNLIAQAKALHFYENTVVHDANAVLPFPDGFFQTVFSNILYWLQDVRSSLKEIHRVLKPGGKAILCMPTDNFYKNCISYSWQQNGDELLKLVNRGRSDCMHACFSFEEFRKIAQDQGYCIDDHRYYLSPLVLKVWDIGLRPMTPIMISLISKLSQEDRRTFKTEWIKTAGKFLRPILGKEPQNSKESGFQLFVLKK
jgi:SAM-dependent methyltransferase